MNLLCKFCTHICQKPCGLFMHERSCKKNPDRIPGNRSGAAQPMSEETKAKVAAVWTGRAHSAETKLKISSARIRYLDANPDQVPYLLNHHSKGPSYPERYWEDVLSSAQITFIKEHRVGRFRIDFAIGKIALEVDGEQHYTDQRIVESNKRRDIKLADEGWTTIRIRWSSYMKMNESDRLQYRTSLLQQLKQQ